jgi:serine protease AprX
MVKFRYFLFLYFLMVPALTQAQNKYAVYYKFKPQENFSLSKPEQFLTQKSIQRRQKENVKTDSLDLPVSAKYLKRLESMADEVLYSSKWLNATVVSANDMAVAEMLKLDFVKDVELLAPGTSSKSPSASLRKNIQEVDELNLNIPYQLNSYVAQNELIGIPKMHREGYQGKGITIAVFDAGFPGVDRIKGFQHLFAGNKILATKDLVRLNNSNVFTDNQHGTNVLSLISANDPDLIVAGAYEANLILCITEDVRSEFKIEEFNWLRAAEFADSLGTDIIHSSLGYWDFDDPTMNYQFTDLNGKTAIVSKAATIASEKGILVVVSAGNYGAKGISSITPPADAKSILSIGSVNSDLSLSGFSSKGPTVDQRIKPELVTIGAGVFLLRSNGQLQTSNGTSFSAPQITALAAGVLQAKPQLKKNELIQYLIESASNFKNPNNEIGYGIPNFEKLMKSIANFETEIEPKDNKIYPNPLIGNNGLYIEENEGLEMLLKLLDTRGIVVLEEVAKRNSIKEPFYIPLVKVAPGFYWLEMITKNDLKRTRLIKN